MGKVQKKKTRAAFICCQPFLVSLQLLMLGHYKDTICLVSESKDVARE